MTYIELLNEFWKQDGFKPFGAMETKVYLYLLHQCFIRDWLSPFELQTRNLELSLGITRKMIQESKNRLKQRGMIDFTDGNRGKTPSYIISGLSKFYVSPRNITGNISGNTNGNITGNISGNTNEEKSPTPPKEEIYISDVNNNISITRTREEIELEKFDSLLQEVVEGKHQIWEDQMRKKFGIDNVIDYLPSFRDHAIANAKLNSVSDISEFKRYFVNSFRFFSKLSPIQLLMQYRSNSQYEKFTKYCDWVKDKAPNVANCIIPLTEEELNNLTDVFGSKSVFNAILDLNNREDLVNKYFSLYRTLIKWLEKDKL